MADRKQFLNAAPADPELLRLLEETRHLTLTDEMLGEQRISFAYGNAMGSELSTKESIRRTALHPWSQAQ